MERDQTCCFTGHRTLPRGIIRHLIPRITDGVSYLLDHNVRHFWLGGAIGFDTVCARTLLCMKFSGYDLDIHLALPCNDQDALWPSEDREIYREVMKYATSVTHIEEHYNKWCMSKRNQFMIDSSSFCIAYVERAKSGAGQTLRMAQKAGLTVYNLAPDVIKASGLE